MGTKMFLALCAAAEAFLLYVLFHFVKEGKRSRPNQKVVSIRVARIDATEGRKRHQNDSKAA